MSRPPRPMSERRPRRAQINAEQLASLSHEFRTPLNGILGMTRLLEGTQLSAEQRAYVTALRDSGEHLLNLANDMLDFAKLGEGKLDLNAEPVAVDDLLRGVAELLWPKAREKQLDIAWAAPADAGRIRADESRVKQILLNFAGNAVKYTPAGGVMLGVTRDGARLRFTVEDTGPGVVEADRERIFEAFAQTEVAKAEIGGTGLGLAIARRLAQGMGGEVGVETARGGGALFWFDAPLPALKEAASPLPLAGRTVGLASPSAIIREAGRRQIQACGARAVSGSTLGAVMDRSKPGDVLLVDHALAAEGELLDLPRGRQAVVLLSPDERDLMARYRRAGFSGYLIKPLRRASLAERVLIATGAEAAPAKVPDDERIAKAAAPGARVLLVEDNPINAMLARALLNREGCEVDHVLTGGEAINAVKIATFDIIFMDMRMPGLSGEETAQLLRAEGVRTPIVALTANAFDDDRQACLAAGMDDFLVKPLAPDALRGCLTRFTRGGWTEFAARAKVR